MNVRCILFVLLIWSAVLGSCAAQTYTVEIEPSGTKVLKGYFDRHVMEEDPHFSWFKTNYDAYQLDSSITAQIATLTDDVHFIMVVGTWCGDSKRELPKQFKILDAAKVPEDNVTIFGVDRSKKSQEGTTDKYTILRVPTLIVFRGEQELGRIVEHPRVTNEADLLRLLSK